MECSQAGILLVFARTNNHGDTHIFLIKILSWGALTAKRCFMLKVQAGTGASWGSVWPIWTQVGAAAVGRSRPTLPSPQGGTERGRALNGKIYDRQYFMHTMRGVSRGRQWKADHAAPCIFQQRPNVQQLIKTISWARSWGRKAMSFTELDNPNITRVSELRPTVI